MTNWETVPWIYRWKALKVAQQVRLDTLIRRISEGHYSCPSVSDMEGEDTGKEYHVRVVRNSSDLFIFCSCPAGERNRACKHAAAMWMYIVRRRKGTRIKRMTQNMAYWEMQRHQRRMEAS